MPETRHKLTPDLVHDWRNIGELQRIEEVNAKRLAEAHFDHQTALRVFWGKMHEKFGLFGKRAEINTETMEVIISDAPGPDMLRKLIEGPQGDEPPCQL